ncbi:MAG: RagB/SusD family nutrient uptake outer membrane protein [Porphyromonas sp.]|nr:RagB/SusD family nutrient uptake outer membrane protein [Porphyromonas sp.]
MKNRIYKILLLVLFLGSATSCDKYLDIIPVGEVIPTKSEEYNALLNSAYSIFPRHKELLTMRGVQVDPIIDPWGLSSFPMYKNIYTWTDTSDADDRTEEYPYISFYQTIFYVNDIIAEAPNAEESNGYPLPQIIAESYLLRAYAYFELANMYGPKYAENQRDTKVVPIILIVDTEQVLPRNTLGEIYDQIESDLAKAEEMMTVTTWEKSEDKYKGSKEALYGLASRIYLYKGDWNKSLEYAKKALAISEFLEDFNDSEALMPTHYSSAENVWALEEVVGLNIREFASIQPTFLDTFAEGDLRKSKFFEENMDWMTGEFFTVSVKLTSRDTRSTVRRAEVFLNAAEAAARLGQDQQAKSYMSSLLAKRYTPEHFAAAESQWQALSGQALVEWILQERLKELAVEGHEWYDYKRTSQPALTKTVEGEVYNLKENDPRYVLQIPKSARDANPKLME